MAESELKRHARSSFFQHHLNIQDHFSSRSDLLGKERQPSNSLIGWSFVKMEETNFPNQRMVRRRLVEAQGGAEVRRIHILYFLSRNGCSEHPHLIRVHHLSRNGVRLRDIKRWLGELRGKDMPESFAWSYKRKYKAGYVWQDIVDDDLITPVSDNEYVLKGSEVSSSIDFSITPMQKDPTEDSQIASSQERENDSSNYVSSNTSSSSSSSSSAQESSPSFGSETSTSTDDSAVRDDQEKNSSTSMALLKKSNGKSSSSSKKGGPSDKANERKSSHSSGILQNLFTCGGVDTNDSVVMYKPLLKTCSCDSADVKDKVEHKPPRAAAAAAAYRPLYGPNCAQCGKTFKPEKLHSHMSSCKGMKKALPKTDNISKISTNQESPSAYLITLKS